MSIDLNPIFARTLELLENTSKHVFITGKAGTGKSTFLDYFRTHTAKRVVVLAPTGVAALNVRGQTIHSFFGWKPHIAPQDIKPSKKLRELFSKIDMIIIDEISMVRADILDLIDITLRVNREGNGGVAFGGIQMVFIGDLYQLPPVLTNAEKPYFMERYSTPYFFGAQAFVDRTFDMEFVEFETIYRQKDDVFIGLLNRIRNNTPESTDIELLTSRMIEPKRDEGFVITLATTNTIADRVNESEIETLPGKMISFEGEILGHFEAKNLPTDETLSLKIGAQIMFVANDSKGRWVNGTIGKILDFTTNAKGDDCLKIITEDAEEYLVERYTWELYQYGLDEFTGVPEAQVAGTFTQFPVRLAWALTIHKSQGKTFDRVIVDIGNGSFAHGQVYVALSRCRSLEGLYLKKRIEKRHIMMDYAVTRFVTQYQYRIAEKQMGKEDRIRFIEQSILNAKDIDMLYLKGKDEKSRRRVTPRSIGDMVHMGKKYLGMVAFCHERQEERVFAVARILEMKQVENI